MDRYELVVLKTLAICEYGVSLPCSSFTTCRKYMFYWIIYLALQTIYVVWITFWQFKTFS